MAGYCPINGWPKSEAHGPCGLCPTCTGRRTHTDYEAGSGGTFSTYPTDPAPGPAWREQPPPKIIAFAGPSKSGKDFAADYLMTLAKGWKLNLADPIKQILSAGLDIPDLYLYGSKKDATWSTSLPSFLNKHDQFIRAARSVLGGMVDSHTDTLSTWFIQELDKATLSNRLLHLHPRGMMQRLGSEWGRDIMGQDIWLNATLEEIHEGERYDEKHGSPPRIAFVTGVRFMNEIDGLKAAGGRVYKINRVGAPPTHSTAHRSEKALLDIPDHAFWKVLNVPEGVEEAKEYLRMHVSL